MEQIENVEKKSVITLNENVSNTSSNKLMSDWGRKQSLRMYF